MKMKRLASIINPMSEEKSHQAPSLDNEGIGDKISGFAEFATSKKGNKGASININGFELQALVKKNLFKAQVIATRVSLLSHWLKQNLFKAQMIATRVSLLSHWLKKNLFKVQVIATRVSLLSL